ncbi:MAG: anion permease [Brevinematia bacterium]
MTIIIFTVAISMFLAINMGASGFSISFAPSYGCGLLKRKNAILLYSIFLFIGALLVGHKVVDTLTLKLVRGFDNPISGLIILFSASTTMFLANILKIPQSTSFVMVGAFTGSGIYYGKTNFLKLAEIFGVALVFSLLAFGVTYALMSLFYPPKERNFRLYEKFAANNKLLRNFILYTDCYSAFAVGTNNVANVVAPVIISGLALPSLFLLAIFAPFFGLGGFLFGKGVINTISKEIIPLGEISAGVVSLVTSSFVIFASLLGMPTPYVQFTTFAILAISAIKDGIGLTARKLLVKKIIFTWILIPIITGVLSYLLHKVIIR